MQWKRFKKYKYSRLGVSQGQKLLPKDGAPTFSSYLRSSEAKKTWREPAGWMSLLNGLAHGLYIFPNVYVTHNLYGPRVNCIYIVNKCLKKTAYLLRQCVKKICFLLTLIFFLMKNGYSLINFDEIFPIRSSIGNTIFRYNFPV